MVLRHVLPNQTAYWVISDAPRMAGRVEFLLGSIALESISGAFGQIRTFVANRIADNLSQSESLRMSHVDPDKEMIPEPAHPRIFDVEGEEIRCYELDGDRLWRCECAAFQRRLERFGQGFCAHTAVAIERCITDGSISF